MVERKAYEVMLPSKGKFYDGKLPEGKVEVYPIRAYEEKLLAGFAGNASEATSALLKSCLKTEFDVKEFLLVDRFYLLVYLSSLSYGKERKITVTCPYCSNQFAHEVDMESFDVKYADDALEDPRVVELPVSKDKVEIKLLRGKDESKIVSMSNRIRQSQKGVNGVDSAHILQMIVPVVSVNGKPIDGNDKIEWIENLIGRDAAALRKAVTDVDFGVNTSTEATCPACSKFANFEFPAENFFDSNG